VTSALAGWPYVQHRAQVGGHSMAYVDEGSGPPVVLVHGNPTWSFYYRSLLAALPPLGCGCSRRTTSDGTVRQALGEDYPHTLSRRVADLGEWLDGLGLTEPVSLVVHDWGGAIALSWASTTSTRSDKLVILNTGFFPLPTARRSLDAQDRPAAAGGRPGRAPAQRLLLGAP
jgi:haloalkane dehalogenase